MNTEIENIKANVDHPAHYGGKDNPYETIKVIEAWGLDTNFDIATAIKYLSRLGKKAGNPLLQDLMKAKFYIDHEVEKRSHSVSEDDNTLFDEFVKQVANSGSTYTIVPKHIQNIIYELADYFFGDADDVSITSDDNGSLILTPCYDDDEDDEDETEDDDYDDYGYFDEAGALT